MTTTRTREAGDMCSNPTVLIVDADTDVRSLLSAFLSERGYLVSTATTGLEGMALLRRKRPDVLLASVEMPEPGGLALLHRAVVAGIDVAAIMISAHDDEEACRAAIRLGAVDFLTKPIDLECLETSLQAKLLAAASLPAADG